MQGRHLVPRRDWLLWQHVNAALPFDIHYSDCGHVHASLEEPPGAAMARATISVRYAIDDNWIVRKGHPIAGPNGQDMTMQYRGHAQALMTEAQFNSLAGCWADAQITNYAAGPGGAGGRTEWAAIGMNRHLSLVADRLP